MKKFIILISLSFILLLTGCTQENSQQESIDSSLEAINNRKAYINSFENYSTIAVKKNNIYYLPKNYKFVNFNNKTHSCGEVIIYRPMRNDEYPETYTIQNYYGDIITVVESK